ncbi:MAG: hypothetical protein H6622_16120 [Halobacteriovoraceae bacterium]|nr:hypothetical protein [Halobacteriovoraceae bacterium]
MTIDEIKAFVFKELISQVKLPYVELDCLYNEDIIKSYSNSIQNEILKTLKKHTLVESKDNNLQNILVKELTDDFFFFVL